MDPSSKNPANPLGRLIDKSTRSIKRLCFLLLNGRKSSQFFHMRTQWTIPGEVDEVADLMLDTSKLPQWWSDCFYSTEIVRPGDEHANGRVFNIVTRGLLPYYLRFQVELVEVKYPYHFVLQSRGNFTGRGSGRLRQKKDCVIIDFDWKIRFTKPFLNRLCLFLKPFYIANHRWVMNRGQIQAIEAIQARRMGIFPTRSLRNQRGMRSRGWADVLDFYEITKQLIYPRRDPSAVWAATQEVAGG